MKKILYLISIMLIFSVLIFQTSCEKDAINPISPTDNDIMNITLKSSQNTDDSLLCVRIGAFLDSIDRNGSAPIEYDSATFYLEASVNYHYGRADEKYGSSLVDSFDVTLVMSTYDKTNYGKTGDTRDDIVDGLKDIYDDIDEDDDDKFMVFTDVHPIAHTSTSVTYRVFAGFAWDEFVAFDEDEPYGDSKSGHWQTQAPTMIKNAALALYGLDGILGSSGFYSDIAHRYWQYHPTSSPYWDVYRSEVYPYPTVSVNIVNHYTQTNYMDYYIFWQKHYLYNPPVGVHTVLSNQELNYYAYKVKYGLNNHTYGNPGSEYSFMGLNIFWHETIDPSNNQWDKRYYNHTHYFGIPRPCMVENYQLELEDWGS